MKFNKYRALWDTGATYSVISRRVVRDLSLVSETLTQISGVGGVFDSEIHTVNIELPNRVVLYDKNVTVAIIDDCDFLIGMDIIGLGDFAISHKGSNHLLSFRIPPSGAIDFTADNSVVTHTGNKRKQKHSKSRSNKNNKHNN
jgi:hypothetical protein